MFRLFPVLVFSFCLSIGAAPSVAQIAEDPASALWEKAYAWLQTGRNLENANQWALAQGSYIEALRKLEQVAEDHPDFETEIVNYRIESMKESMSEIEGRMESTDHDVTMKYLDFIESLEVGETQRYSRNYSQALETLEFAKTLLEEVIDTDPESIRSAVDSQYTRIDSSIQWLGDFLNLKRLSTPRTTYADTVDWGTTRYVKLEDLPQEESGGATVSGLLFPIRSNLDEETDDSGESHPDTGGPE